MNDRIMYRVSVFALLTLLFSPPLFARNEEDAPAFDEAVPEPPVIPQALESGEVIEPEVTIIRKEEQVIEEYRVNHRLYMVKITPKVGKPYFLIDRDGDGRMEARMSEIYDDFVVPQWVLFSW